MKKKLDLKHYYYIDMSSSEFKNIISKYKSPKNESNEELKTFNLIQAFEQQKKEVENKESDEDFMLRDLKQLRRIETELLENYGLKSKEEHFPIPESKFETKIDKSKFQNLIFGLNKRNNLNNFVNNNKKKNKKKTVINLPYINNKNDTSFNPNSSFYSQMPLDKSINVTKQSIMSINENEKSFISNNNNVCNSQRLEPIREKYYYTEKNQINNNKNIESLKNNKKNKNKEIRRNYIQILNHEKNKFTNEKKKYQKLFGNNDYGYKKSKMKYHYLMEKYF